MLLRTETLLIILFLPMAWFVSSVRRELLLLLNRLRNLLIGQSGKRPGRLNLVRFLPRSIGALGASIAGSSRAGGHAPATPVTRVGRGPEAPEARGARNRRGVPRREAPLKSPRRQN